MTFCVSTGVGTWTNWSIFDHCPDAGTELLSPILYALQRGILVPVLYVGKIPHTGYSADHGYSAPVAAATHGFEAPKHRCRR